jgi:pimeloyl-ACP methyl ester carboxylesterase
VQIAHGLVEMIPGADRVVAIDGASHFLQEDKPDEVAEAIVALLAR